MEGSWVFCRFYFGFLFFSNCVLQLGLAGVILVGGGCKVMEQAGGVQGQACGGSRDQV